MGSSVRQGVTLVLLLEHRDGPNELGEALIFLKKWLCKGRQGKKSNNPCFSVVYLDLIVRVHSCELRFETTRSTNEKEFQGSRSFVVSQFQCCCFDFAAPLSSVLDTSVSRIRLRSFDIIDKDVSSRHLVSVRFDSKEVAARAGEEEAEEGRTEVEHSYHLLG